MTHFSQFAETLRYWLSSIGIAVLVILAILLVKRVVIRRLERIAHDSQTRTGEFVRACMHATRIWLVTVMALALGLQTVNLPHAVNRGLTAVGTVAVFLQIGLWLRSVWNLWIAHSRAREEAIDAAAATSLSALRFLGELVLWIVLTLLVLDNLGFNITTLIAGLGIGGVAVALAVQNILGDLFASLSILIDKPFVIGDFIILDSYMGTVENVGLKTTRIRSLDGEQIIFANSDLLRNRVRNYKRMRERRVLFNLGVLYQTRPEQLEKIPALVRAIVGEQAKSRFERCHCARFSDSAIEFETVYWVLDPDYNLYMDIQQAINFGIKRRFEENGIDFAFPTQTIVFDGPLRIARETLR